MAASAILTGIFSVGEKLIDHFFPDDLKKDEKKAEFALLVQQGQLKELEISMSAIIAEANSSDKWTSRARPSFLYLFYLVIAFLVIVFPAIGIWFPEEMYRFYGNVKEGFAAIPEPMWWTFSAGYLGYAANRTYEKTKGVAK